MSPRIFAVALCLALIAPAYPADQEASPQEASPLPKQNKEVSAAPAQASQTDIPPKQLSEEEESSLASRSEEPGPEVAGGALSNLHLTYAVIALAAIVLVLLIK